MMAKRPMHFNYRAAQADSPDCCSDCDALESRERCSDCEVRRCPVKVPDHKVGDNPCPYGGEGHYFYCPLQDAEVLPGNVCDHVFSSRPAHLPLPEGLNA